MATPKDRDLLYIGQSAATLWHDAAHCGTLRLWLIITRCG